MLIMHTHKKDDKHDKDDKHSEEVGYLGNGTSLSSLSCRSSESPVCDDKQANYEERAAIMEYDGGLSRAAAEREAQRLTGYKAETNGVER